MSRYFLHLIYKYLENEEHPESSAEGGDGEEVADAEPEDHSQRHRGIERYWVDFRDQVDQDLREEFAS